MLLFGSTIIIVALVLMIFISIFNLPSVFALVIIMVYIIGFSLSFGPIAFIYIADILPDSGVSICICALWFFTIIVGKIFPLIVENYGI